MSSLMLFGAQVLASQVVQRCVRVDAQVGRASRCQLGVAAMANDLEGATEGNVATILWHTGLAYDAEMCELALHNGCIRV
jgi:hypothetical protein